MLTYRCYLLDERDHINSFIEVSAFSERTRSGKPDNTRSQPAGPSNCGAGAKWSAKGAAFRGS